MRIGIIDLGTNSVRFDVHQIGPGRSTRRLHREKIMVRLGEGVFLNGKLNPNATARTTHAFLRFKRIAQRLKAAKILAFGTSALREASDQVRFVRSIEEKTGIHVRVISGKEEASLIATGILSREKIKEKLFTLIDIGGGSTEISICRSKKILHASSFPVGTARIQQLFLKKSPPSLKDVDLARAHIRSTLLDIMTGEGWAGAPTVIGSSGTMRALERIYRQSGEKGSMELKWLKQLNRRISKLTTSQLLGVPGMEEKRVDMILAGSLLLEECMTALGARKASATEYSLRDGILEEEIRLFREGGGSHLALHLDDLFEKARRFGIDPEHSRRTAQLAEEIFKSLKPLHRLEPKWRIYLTAAAVLRETGEAISLFAHPAHSEYVVRHSDLLGLEDWEIDLLARLVAHHEDLKLSSDFLSGLKSSAVKEAARKLLGLLCFLDELDSGPDSEPRVRSLRLARGRAFVTIGGKGLTGLEELNVSRRSQLFKKTLGRELSAGKG